MVRTCLLVLFSLILLAPTAANGAPRPALSVSIQSPQTNQVVSQSLSVSVGVQTTYDIAEVSAVVDGQTVRLTFHGSLFVGTLSMVGIPSGTKLLTVTATDVFGNTVSAERAFILDRYPTLTVQSPVDWSVTRGLVSVSATCSDVEGPCQLSVSPGGTETLSGTSSVSGTFDLSGYDGGRIRIEFSVRDSRGQGGSVFRWVYVATSPKWVEKEAVSGEILDVNAGRILFASGPVSYHEWLNASVLDRVTGAVAAIPLPQNRTMYGNTSARQGAFLTQRGVVFTSGKYGGYSIDALMYDWNDGELIDLGYPGNASSLSAAGDYATWMGGVGTISGTTKLYIRNLLTRANSIVSSEGSSNNGFPVSPDGRIVYSRGYPDGISFIYENGESKIFADGNAAGVQYVGDSTYYYNRLLSPNMSIWLFDGDTYRLQADNVYWGQFDARGGWMAFTRLGNLGQELVWLRSPNGDERQITFFSASSKVEAVSPTGEVFYIYNRRRYLSSPAGELVEIGSDQGEVLWLDGEWTLSLGRSLFALDPQTVAVEADTPALSADATVGSVFPNPTSARATITFSLPSAGFVRLSVLDPIGRRVATLAEGDYAVGNHTVEWESARASSGVYTISLETSTGTVSKRLTVVR